MTTTTPEAELEGLLSESSAAAHARAEQRVILESSDKIVLYGAGVTGRTTLARLRRAGVEPAAFADDTPAKLDQIVDGVPVITPSQAAERFGPRLVFVVTILNGALRFVAARERLRQFAPAPVWSVADLAWKFPGAFLPYLHVELPQHILEQERAIRRAFSVWADDESRRQFTAHLRFRLHLDYESLPPNSREGYFPSDVLPTLGDGAIFLDGGAYDGDSVRAFLSHQQGKFGAVHAFEPDAANYHRLTAYVKGLSADCGRRIHLHNVGLGARRETMRFDQTGDMSAALSDTGRVDVDVWPLDEIVHDTGAATYLKLDVEGAELDALHGAHALLTGARPILAVSVYHRPDDLWAIPLYVDALGAGYHQYLRTQGEDGTDVICYAIPDSFSP